MPRINVLIVDDELGMLDYISDVVEDMDMDCDITSINDSMQFSSVFSPETDILILDLFMPGIDGIELLRLLPNVNPYVAVIFISGKDIGILHSAEKLALEQGISVLGVLEKPFSPDQLEETIKKHKRPPICNTQSKQALPTKDELQAAIDNNDLYMVYQPQVNILDRSIIGVEALIRWNHHDKGAISPAVFIPFSEKVGLISAITTFSAKAAIKQAGIWKKQGIKLRMSINMSPKIINDLNMPEKLAEYASEAEVDVSDIMIEVTETAVTPDVGCYIDILTRLRMKGFGLSIDDFGTGYSSLQQLLQISFTELKVDQSFVSNLKIDSDHRTITEISILLAHKLGMQVVAEGIEDEGVWNILHEMGCDEGQGYWMGRPMSADNFETWKIDWESSI